VRIAIDGQFLRMPPSGTGVYVRNLLRALPGAAPDLSIDVLEPRDIPFLPGGLGREPRLRRFWWETAGAGTAARRLGPDLLHIPSFAAPLRARTPLVVTIHDAIPLVLPEYRASMAMRAHLALMRRSTLAARLVLTPSRSAANDLERLLGIPADRIRVTPLAADPACRPPADCDREIIEAARARFDVRGPYVFTVAGLDARKRVDVVLEAFAMALPDLPPDTTLVIGGVAHRDNAVVYPPLDPIVDRLGIGDRVRVTGWLDDATKVALYQGAAAAVTASIYEGFGLTVLEAMACGAPTIATPLTSLPEVAGDAALLVDPDPEAWRAALVRVVIDHTLAACLRERGLARAAEFSWERTATATAAAYREAIAMGESQP
jgi:glycosyltransferase involved in cell wall biosynthesis